MGLFDRMAISRKLNSEKALIKSTEQFLERTAEAISGSVEASSASVIKSFRTLAEDRQLLEVLQKFPEEVQVDAEGAVWLHHAGELNRIFYLAAQKVGPQDVFALQDIMSKSDSLKTTSNMRTGNIDHVFLGMSEMAAKCPVPQKIDLFTKFETSGYLGKHLPRQGADTVASFLAKSFKDVEVNQALKTLSLSDAWRATPKNLNMRQGLQEYGAPELIAAL